MKSHPARAILGIAALSLAAGVTGCAQSSRGVQGSHIVTLDRGPAEGDVASITVLHLPMPSESDPGATIEYDQISAYPAGPGGFASVEVSDDGRYLACASSASGAASIYAMDERKPRILAMISDDEGVSTPIAIDFHPTAPLLACLDRHSAMLTFIEIVDERPRIYSYDLAEFVGPGPDPVDIDWRPNGEEFAIAFERDGLIARFSLMRDGAGSRTIRPIGSPVAIAHRPVNVTYSQSGDQLLVVDDVWKDMPGVIVHSASVSLLSIRVPRTEDPWDGAELIQRSFISAAPDAVALSRDGRFLAAVTANHDDLALANDERRTGGKLTLMSVNSTTGEIATIDEQRICSLPTDVAFDAKSAHLLITDGERDQIQIWRVDRRNGNMLEFTGRTIGSGENPVAVAVAP